MFNSLNENLTIITPISGRIIDLSEVPDQLFAQKVVGDGVGIDSTGDMVVSPADGTIALIFKTNRAFVVKLDNGIELLIHIGTEAVELEGLNFERLVQERTKVKAGEPIIRFNMDLIKEKGYSLITTVVVTNIDKLEEIKYKTNTIVEAGKDVVISYKIKEMTSMFNL